MSATVKIINHLEVSLGGELVEIGSRSTPVEVTIEGEKFEAITQVTNAADPNDFVRQLLWVAGDGGVDDFDVLAFLSDTDVLLELQNSDGTYATIAVEADFLLILAPDDLLATVTTDGTESTLFAIDEIAVQNNNDDTSTATVRLLLLT